MNWIKKIKYFGEKIKKNLKKKFPTKEERENSEWTSCCTGPILKKDLENNNWVCNACGKHHRLNCLQRFDLLFSKGNYKIIDTPIPEEDPLEWNDTKSYKERLAQAKRKTGQNCAVMIAEGKINNIKVTVGAINFDFIGGSVGSAEGEAIIYGIQHAINNKTPFVFFPCGGGQRMFQSPIALANMTRTTLAVNELKDNDLPYIIIFTDPTAGGITASFAMLGDIHLAEPGCLIAFAGRRVIQATVKEELTSDFQTAEFCQKHGFVDRIVHRADLKSEIGILLSIFINKKVEINSNKIDEASDNIKKISKFAS